MTDGQAMTAADVPRHTAEFLQPGEYVVWMGKPVGKVKLTGQAGKTRKAMQVIAILALGLISWSLSQGKIIDVLVGGIALCCSLMMLVQFWSTTEMAKAKYTSYYLTDRRAVRVFSDHQLTIVAAVPLNSLTQVGLVANEHLSGHLLFQRRTAPGDPTAAIARFIPESSRVSSVSFDFVADAQYAYQVAQWAVARNAA